MASSLYILDMKGRPLIQKAYRGDVPNSVVENFGKCVIDEDEANVKPVFEHNGLTYIFIQHTNIYILAVTRRNCNVSMLISFLLKVVQVLKGYFEKVDEESIRDNFSVVYELLDEMMDFGYPQFTETNILKQFITQESNKLKQFIDDITKGNEEKGAAKGPIEGSVPWRPPNIVHRKNEIFLDVIERVNLLVSAAGETLQSEIHGVLEMDCRLSGMPELRLGLNDKILFENSQKRASKRRTVDMEDIKFHQCVKLNRFENDRTISFIPPDGRFDLMSYRLSTKVKPMILINSRVLAHGTSRIEYSVSCKSQFKQHCAASGIEILVPVPPDADSPNFKTSAGTVKYAPEQDAILWKIKMLPGGKEYNMIASFGLPSIRAEKEQTLNSKRPISVKFEIPFHTVSGLQVRYLKLAEKMAYEPLPWVRYITRSGDYQIRMS